MDRSEGERRPAERAADQPETEGSRASRSRRSVTSSAQATDHSRPHQWERSFPPLDLLSPPNPLRWASVGASLRGAPGSCLMTR